MYQFDSRKIKPGDIYICLPKGQAYISDAYKKGAAGVWITSRGHMAQVANSYYQAPSQELRVIGVTGTNGKTTVCHMVSQALAHFNETPYCLGTLNSPLTTPESMDIQRLMREHKRNGGTYFIMEVSSHAIDQHRVDEIQFFCKLLTNITQDHLDYHHTLAAYKACKLSFMEGPSTHTIFPKDYMSGPKIITPNFIGEFNSENTQAAAAILRSCGFSVAEIQDAFQHIQPPPGRFETINGGQNFTVIVDYAHTPDGLKSVCSEAKSISKQGNGKLITVFGCGGDRDRGKRPLMGAVAQEYSDLIVLTQDNPRTENPQQILDDIKKGFNTASMPIKIEEDRSQAISYAIAQAQLGDVVLIAGKGHEDYQIIGKERHHFDDRKKARNALAKLEL